MKANLIGLAYAVLAALPMAVAAVPAEWELLERGLREPVLKDTGFSRPSLKHLDRFVSP